MYNLLLDMTKGEANAMVRRNPKHGWLAWKKLAFVLNPRTLASGIKAISAMLSPYKISRATKADQEIEEWEDQMVKLRAQYNQVLTTKMEVAVLCSMLPKDLKEKVLDECVVNWGGTPEDEAEVLLTRVKSHINEIAKARRETSGPRLMDVEDVSSWEIWSGWGSWRSSIGSDAREPWSGDEKSALVGCDIQRARKGGKNGEKRFPKALHRLR